MKGYFPIFISLSKQHCLVVGGGKVAERKIKNILPLSPIITVVAPELSPYLKRLVEKGRLFWIERPFLEKDIEGKFIVFVATNDEKLNEKIACLCKERGILVNVAKPGNAGNFIVPSFLKKGGLSIAFSTEGEAPFFSALIKRDMQKRHNLYSQLLAILKPFRSHLLTSKGMKGYNKLIQVHKTFFNERVLSLLEKGEREKVKAIAEEFFIRKEQD